MSITKTIKKISISILMALTVCALFLGGFFSADQVRARADGESNAYFLYRDDDTKGSWYLGDTTTKETASNRIYGQAGYMIPYMNCIPGLANGLGQPATDVERINDFSEQSMVNCVEHPSWLSGITSYIKSTRDTPHGYWMYCEYPDMPMEYVLKAPDVDKYVTESGKRVICHQQSVAEIEYDFHVNDNEWHRIAVYMQSIYSNFVENPSKNANISIWDLNGNELEKTYAKGYDNGVWFVFAVKGSFRIRMEGVDGATSTSVAGIFLDEEYENSEIGVSEMGAMREGVKTIHLSWQRNTEDTVAMIYRKEKNEGSYQPLAFVDGTTYIDNDTQPSCVYSYMFVPAKKRIVQDGVMPGAYDVLIPDESLTIQKETAPYDLTKIEFEKESYVVPYGEELAVQVKVYRQSNGEYVPYPGIAVSFKLAGGLSQYYIGTTAYANMNLDLATVTTDENGVAKFSYQQEYAGEFSVVASIDAVPDENDNEKGTAASSESTVFVQLEKADEHTPFLVSISDAIKPGESVTITGSNLLPNVDLCVAYAPSLNGAPTAFDENNEPYNCKYLTLEDLIVTDSTYETGLAFVFPKTEQAGTYDVWVKTTYGWSNGITLNAARPLYMNQDGGFEGATIELVGRNFYVSDFGVGTREDAPSNIRVKLVRIGDVNGVADGINETAIVKVKTGIRTEAAQAVNKKDIDWTNPYKISFEIPKVTNYGEYAVYVAADGVCYQALKQPQTLTIFEKKAQIWDETVFGAIPGNTHVGNDPLDLGYYWAQDLNYTNVLTATPNDAPGEELTNNAGVQTTTNDIVSKMNTLNLQGGGVLYFPEGEYYIASIRIPENVILVGAGAEKTKVYCVTQTGGGIWIESLSSNVGIARMHLELYEKSSANPDWIFYAHESTSVGSYIDPNLTTVNKFVTDCTTKFGTEVQADGKNTRAMLGLSGKAYYLLQNVYYDGGNNPMHCSYVPAYATMRNVVAVNISGMSVAPSVHCSYTFIENVYADLNDDGHAFSLRDCAYIADSFVTGSGSYNGGNIGEMIVFEPPGGYFLTGTILSATARTFTMGLNAGTMIDENTFYKYNGFALYITAGKGAGQLRYFEKTPLNEYGNQYALCTGERDWDIIPDSTSQFTVISPIEGATVYRFEGTDNKKGIFLYSTMFDSVVAECNLWETEGIYVCATDISKTGRFCPNIGVRIENNVLSGISPMTGNGGIGFRSERNSSAPSWGVQIMNVSIRGNTLIDVDGEYTDYHHPYDSEMSDERGIVIVTGATGSGQTAGDVRFVTIENNTLENCEYGIYVENRITGVIIRNNQIGTVSASEKVTYFAPEQLYLTAEHTFYFGGSLNYLNGEYVYGLELPTLADTQTDVFLGWSLSETYDSTLGIATTAFNSNVTLYAVYGKQITFDLNYTKSSGAAAGTFNEIKVVTGSVVEEEIALYGNPFRVGYQFGGWYTDKNCTQSFDASQGINENLTVYAKWTSNTSSDGNTQTPVTEQPNNGWVVAVAISGGVVLLAAGAFIVFKKLNKNK